MNRSNRKNPHESLTRDEHSAEIFRFSSSPGKFIRIQDMELIVAAKIRFRIDCGFHRSKMRNGVAEVCVTGHS